MALYPSNTAIESLLDVITDNTPHLALYTTNPTAADTGTELTGGSYARQPITFGATSGGARSNSAAVEFTGLGAATVTHYAIRDAITGGNLLGFAELDNPVVLELGDQVVFSIGSIEVTVAGS